MTAIAVPISVVDLRNSPKGAIAALKSPVAARHRGLVITLARLPIAAAGVLAVVGARPGVATLCFALFALVDIADGMIARRDGADGALRRATDVVVDRVCIHAASLTCVAVYGSALTICLAFLSRDIIQGIYCAHAAKRHRVVFVGPKSHMAYGLTFLVWGSYFIVNGQSSTTLSVLLAAVSAATMVDFVRRTEAVIRVRRTAISYGA